METIQTIRARLAGSQADASHICLLSKEEFEAIKREAMSMTGNVRSSQWLHEQEEAERHHEARKSQMAAALASRQGAGLVTENEFEAEARENRQRLRLLRDSAMIESLDEVKQMNQMVAYAKAAYVRDKQLEEKKKLRSHKVDEEKRKDLMMEVERLRLAKIQAEADERRHQNELAGKQVIVDQIQERELQRLKDKEILAKEGEDMLRKLKQLEIEEKEAAAARIVKQKQLLEEMLGHNETIMKAREEKAAQEKLETEKAMRYLIEQQEKEAKQREEKARIQQQKELETAKLREKQEKAQDRNKDIDEIRARRAVEKAERAYRLKEAQEAAKKAEM